jgi:hypothetical protein
VPGVRASLRSVDLDPRSLPKTLVDVDLGARSVGAAVSAGNDGSILATDRAPDDVWRTSRDSAISRLQADSSSLAELLGVGDDLVVDRELVGVCDDWSTTVFVCHDVLAIGQLGNSRHSWAVGVGRVGDVVDDWSPLLEVGGSLVNHLLTVGGVVSLVGVVADEGLLVHHQERLPNRSQTIVGASFTTSCDGRNKLPSLAAILGCVEDDFRGGKVGGDGGSRYQDGAGLVATNLLGQHVEEWLVAQTKAILSILNARKLLPRLSSVGRLEDREVNFWWLRRVVLPCCKKRTVGELRTAGVKHTRVGPVGVSGWREDHVAREGRLFSLLRERRNNCRRHANEREEEGGETHLEGLRNVQDDGARNADGVDVVYKQTPIQVFRSFYQDPYHHAMRSVVCSRYLVRDSSRSLSVNVMLPCHIW